MIYIGIISQKKASYGGSKKLILIQGSCSQKKDFLMNKKGYLTVKATPLLRKSNNKQKNIKTIFCDNASKNKDLEENCTEIF